MLPLSPSRCAGAIVRHSLRRAQSTITSSSGSQLSDEFKPKRDRPSRGAAKSLLVRTRSRGIGSMSEAFALIRALEMEYGKIRDIDMGRDPDSEELYNPNFYVSFHNEEILQRIAKLDTETTQLHIPAFSPQPPGLVGLEDLDGLLSPKDGSPGDADPWADVTGVPTAENARRPTKAIDVKLELSSRPTGYKVNREPTNITQGYLQSASRELAQWGGFYNPALQPRRSSADEGSASPISSESPSSKYMQAVQRKWKITAIEVRSNPNQEGLRNLQERAEEAPEDSTMQSVVDAFMRVELVKDTAIADNSPPPQEVALEQNATAITPSRSSKRERILDLAREQTKKKPESGSRASEQERLLELAQQHASKPLPESVIPKSPEMEQEARQNEKRAKRAEEEQAKSTLRHRLSKLMGGIW
ncbi:hypothetical protein PHLCEN_2v8666 [Hermanssonia centrifuga]|uniref:Uncharacterized protein n=1 Tax=Hermanssonia centrifuga TaxID=98765 RepID=A0A2R6NT13_9APHY|nr:hypothetical protein PHLCEN_2v8666 [Hermanssonia centrifuga]